MLRRSDDIFPSLAGPMLVQVVDNEYMVAIIAMRLSDMGLLGELRASDDAKLAA